MKKRNILLGLRNVNIVLHGKRADRQIMLYKIAGIGANGRKIPAYIRNANYKPKSTKPNYQPRTKILYRRG